MSNEVEAFEAVLGNDELGAAVAMAKMTPDQLHELMRVCLVTCDLARASILGPASYTGLDQAENPVAVAHRLVEGLAQE